ncbi:3-methyl-2-oxobutanoate hydroxymethyltransferase [Pelagibius sp. Alg239-R121]|uniref:3-methyl-2-oxobutanoate hydroxymethyltransferase n=1 Tax=Pelagibius sp. Alg239-R121 TaxID=2993448 RepID=UPI0024A72C10|nr:3-methyl-2-oxobutanoate hydroxymethyltransferase [Pelagibius sp. Alg239-R121]
MSDAVKKLTIPDLHEKKCKGERVVLASVTDYLMAQWAERGGVDVVAVGDSLGMITYGHPNTLPMTVDQMIEHIKAVRRGAPNTLCIVAMPFGSYATPQLAVENALRLMKEAGAEAVKLQGGREKFEIIKAVADAGVPVMSHVGMCPHFVNSYGGFKLQGRTAEDAFRIIDNARAIEEAGAVGFEIEAVPPEVGKAVDDAVEIFTFSIGAGGAGCGQLLLGADLIGSFDSFKPKFAKRYGNVGEVATKAFADYAEEVRSGAFPDSEHVYKMPAEEAAKFSAALVVKG